MYIKEVEIHYIISKIDNRIILPLFFLLSFLIFSTWSYSEEIPIDWKASGKGGAVVAGKEESVQSGIFMLEQGGNAVDAAVATILTQSVSEYGAFSIGGEVSFMIYDAKRKEVKVLSGVGTAPLDPEGINWYWTRGIPNYNIKAAAVPGVISLCMRALDLYGTMSFTQVVAPTLRLLESNKEDWYSALAETLRKIVEEEQKTKGTRKEKIRAARDRFYKGDIADELEKYYIKEGSFLRKKDLNEYETRIEDPICVQYRDYTVCKCDTWTQGPMLCQSLRLLEGFDLKKMGNFSADYIHVIAEALKLAFADRDLYYGDPHFVKVPLKALLSEKYTKIRRPLIDMNHASSQPRPGDPINMQPLISSKEFDFRSGGTTNCVVADQWGNLVSATPSSIPGYNICHKLGIAHGNRLSSFNTTYGHPNRIEAGKRPRITLTPTIVLKKGKGILAISAAGGDFQEQATLICLLNFIEFNMLPAEAVSSSRFVIHQFQDSFRSRPNRKKTYCWPKIERLEINDLDDEGIFDYLQKRGHKVFWRNKNWAMAIPAMIHVSHKTGIISAAGDPRRKQSAGALKYYPEKQINEYIERKESLRSFIEKGL